MTKPLPLPLLSSSLFSACTPNPPIVEPAREPVPAAVTSVSGTVHLSGLSRTYAGSPATGHTDADVIDKLLVSSSGNATGIEAKSTATVGSNLKYTITLPTPTDAALLPAAMDDFNACTTTMNATTPGSRATYGTFDLQAHPDQAHPLVSILQAPTGTSTAITSLHVMYYNQDGRTDVVGTCPSDILNRTVQVDVHLTFREGWNVFKQVVTHTLNADGTSSSLTVIRNTGGTLDLYAPSRITARTEHPERTTAPGRGQGRSRFKTPCAVEVNWAE
ncbi:hypothetical protein [Deinococcus enclensis]|uniref:Lipoprotein n=1 Tax=Deinococcus enclensis TaxID=1049582 RepID=A0ABT9MFZ5_9DEIO|nr:hypothetical protein [Deinococcus enclensis]MDP9765475.1 hypothetical protein [Deinococcus enclensis]